MKQMRIMAIAIISVALLVLASGCTQPATNTTVPVTEIRIGYQPSTHQVAHMVAMDKGWWQQDLAPFGIVKVTDYVFPTVHRRCRQCLQGISMSRMSGLPRSFQR